MELAGIIRRFNESVGGVNSDTEGYHETITRAFLHGVRLFLREADSNEPLHELVNELLMSPMGRRDWPLRFYSRERLFSVEARRRFVQPDVAALAVSRLACASSGTGRFSYLCVALAAASPQALMAAPAHHPARRNTPMRGSRRCTIVMPIGTPRRPVSSGIGTARLQPADRLPHVDEASQRRREAHLTEYLRQLNAIPAAQLSPSEQVNAAIFRTVLENALIEARARTWEMPFNSDSSFWTYLDSDSFDSAAEYRRYIARMRDIPRYFDEQTVNMRAGLARGFSVPRATLGGRDASIAAFADDAVEQNPFYKAFEQMPSTIPAAEQERLRAEARAAIEQSVCPAYRKLLGFIRDEYMPKARTTIAARDLPDGDAFYRAQIREYTTTDMSPEEIHQLGLKEVARIDARNAQDDGREPASRARSRTSCKFLKTDPQFYAKTPDELMGVSAYVLERVDGKVGKVIGTVAAAPLRPCPGRRTRSRLSTRRVAAASVRPRLHDEHLRFADAAALQHPGADASRMRARPQPADRRSSRSRRRCRRSAKTSISRAPARAGASTANGSATRWASTARLTSGSAS